VTGMLSIIHVWRVIPGPRRKRWWLWASIATRAV